MKQYETYNKQQNKTRLQSYRNNAKLERESTSRAKKTDFHKH